MSRPGPAADDLPPPGAGDLPPWSPDTSTSTGLPPEPEIVRTLRAAGCVFAEEEAALLLAAAGTPDELSALVDQRVRGLPLEHILGWVEFYGLRLAVDPGVFVPRRRTEFLVRRAVELLGAAPVGAEPVGAERSRPVVVDLCCGCGAVGAALATALGRIELYAADVEPAAVRCARRNLEPLGGRVYQGDLVRPLPPELAGRIDVLAANVPYVPSSAVELMPPEARLHEPRVALDGGPDGLDVLRRVAAAAARWLAPGGHLLVETGQRQAPVAADIFAGHGLTPRIAACEDLEATVVTGTR